jgi:ketosteroid isomerase-like protein
MKIVTVVAEGPHVAVQSESDTAAGNGKKYANRYHFYFRFDGDRIGQVRESTTSTSSAKCFSANEPS